MGRGPRQLYQINKAQIHGLSLHLAGHAAAFINSTSAVGHAGPAKLCTNGCRRRQLLPECPLSFCLRTQLWDSSRALNCRIRCHLSRWSLIAAQPPATWPRSCQGFTGDPKSKDVKCDRTQPAWAKTSSSSFRRHVRGEWMSSRVFVPWLHPCYESIAPQSLCADFPAKALKK